MARRDDVTPEMVGRMWLEGWSVQNMATHFGMNMKGITLRLARARVLHAGWAWDKRVPLRVNPATDGYLDMADGVKGERESAGSFTLRRADRPRR